MTGSSGITDSPVLTLGVDEMVCSAGTGLSSLASVLTTTDVDKALFSSSSDLSPSASGESPFLAVCESSSLSETVMVSGSFLLWPAGRLAKLDGLVSVW